MLFLSFFLLQWGRQSKVEPLIIENLPETFRFITLSVYITNLKETLAFVESQWKVLFPGNPFENFFLDTDFDRQYRADEQVRRWKLNKDEPNSIQSQKPISYVSSFIHS